MTATNALQVIIVEDRHEDAELMVHELRREGFEVRHRRVDTAADFADALATGPDLILSDYNMPRFGGEAALRLLREHGRDIPFIVVTGSISEEVAVACMKQGAADYLLKDRLTRLGPAVRAALESKRMRDAERAAVQAARDSAQTQRILLRELDHRVRNNLASLLSLIDIGRRSAMSVNDFAGSISGRVRAMAGVHDLLSQSQFQALRLSELLRLLSPQYGPGRLQVTGPEVHVPARQVTALGIVLHEVLTNSVKHGALRQPDGSVEICWSVHASDPRRLQITVTDRGGPALTNPPASGAGTHLIEGLVRSELGGACAMSYPSDGARHVFDIMLDRIDPHGTHASPQAQLQESK